MICYNKILTQGCNGSIRTIVMVDDKQQAFSFIYGQYLPEERLFIFCFIILSQKKIKYLMFVFSLNGV